MGKVSISKASEMLGVSIGTLREWERKGLIESYRTFGLHRRYNVDEIKRMGWTNYKMFDVKNDDLIAMTPREIQRYENMMTKCTKEDMAKQWLLHFRECPICTKTED